MSQLPHIVVVGGGAGGLELVTQLGNTLGKRKRAKITLVDSKLTHVWKPLWHEVAAGTLSSNEDEVNYIVHAHNHDFHFQWGSLADLNVAQQQLVLAPVQDKQQVEILPQRLLNYDVLVLAIGSVSYDFKVAGVKSHCFFLDSFTSCQAFQQRLLQHLLQEHPQFNIAIVGGGATGVELAAELQYACQQALQYKQQQNNPVAITIIETAPRILSALPEKIARATAKELRRRGIDVLEGEQVIEVTEEAFYTKSGLKVPAELKIWAAGIQAPELLANLGLQTNQRQQVLVKPTLQTTVADNIFALGDCASCPQSGTEQAVPPRAQAAHQQAALLAKSIPRYLRGQPVAAYHYKDYGALISLGKQNTFGNLMGRATGNIMLQGKLARLAYLSLYRKHQAALFGWWRVALLTIAQRLTSIVRPRLKLH
jgi:NADH dehydrogenase